MSYDGSLKFDTSVDSSGFSSGISTIKNVASTGLKVTAGIIAGAAAGILAFGASAVSAGADFDSAMSQLAATMGTTTDQIEELRDKAKELGASTSFSATEAAEGLNILAQAGYDADQQLEMIESTLNLAAAGATSMDNAASYLTTTLKGYCVSSEETGEKTEYYSNLMAKGATLVNTSVDELGTAMADSAAKATLYGQEVETTTVALLALADGGYAGSEAATALNRLMTDLYAPTSAASEALDELGVSCYTDTGEARSLTDVIADLQDATADMVGEEKSAYLNTILTSQGLSAYGAIATKTADEIDELTNNLLNCEGAAAAMAETQLDNLEGDITKAKSALEGLQIAISDEVSPSLRSLVQLGTEQLSILTDAIGSGGLQGGIESCGEVLANVIGYVADLAPSIIETASGLISSFCEGLKNTTLVTDAVGETITSLISALLSCAGDIWSTALVLVTNLAEGLASNAGEIARAGINMITQLLQAIISNVSTLAQAAVTAVSEFASGLTSNTWALETWGDTAIKTIVDTLGTALPQLADVAVDLINSLTGYLSENFPSMVQSGLETLLSFSDGLRENVGNLVDAALELVKTLAQGIIANIPTIIETVPTIVTNIAGCINDNAPKLIATAAELLGQLALGLVQAIPTLVANIPQIIEAIVAVFTAFNWISLGKNIMSALKNGIKTMVAGLKSAGTDCLNGIYNAIKSLPSKLLSLGKSGGSSMAKGIRGMLSTIKSAATTILNGCVSAITSLPSKLLTIGKNAITKMKSVFKISEWKNIGKNIINGIISGITGMVSKLYSSIKSALSGLVSKAKSALGISSPSKVFRDAIGAFIPQGIAVGVEKNAAVAEAAVEDMADSLSSAGAVDTGSAVALSLDADTSALEEKLKNLGTSVTVALTDKLKSAVEFAQTKLQVGQSERATYQAQKETGTAFTSGDTTVEISGTIETPVTLDGKEVARGITPFVDKELSKRATKKERGSVAYA